MRCLREVMIGIIFYYILFSVLFFFIIMSVKLVLIALFN